MESVLALLLVILVIAAFAAFLFLYPDWLEKKRGCSPASGGRMALGVLMMLCAVLALAGDGALQVVCIILSFTFLMIVLALNYKGSNSFLQASLMTLWQIMAVATVIVAILGLIKTLNDLVNGDNRSKRK